VSSGPGPTVAHVWYVPTSPPHCASRRNSPEPIWRLHRTLAITIAPDLCGAGVRLCSHAQMRFFPPDIHETMDERWSSQQQRLSSFLATVTDGRPGPTTDAGTTITTSASPVERTIVSAGQTVTLTVTTHDATQTPQPTSDSALTIDRSRNTHNTPVGAIAGGTVGGLAFLASALLLLFLLRRRKRVNERRLATLPPPYPGEDMSEELTGQLRRVLVSSCR
jgi:hypothetical protein